jgi:dolichyl-diphosphooligosaccharide---protein glycosyltransferase
MLFQQFVDGLFPLKMKPGDSNPENSSASVASTSSTKSENRTETAAKEKPPKKNRKKEKEVAESASVRPKKERRLLVLPFELSMMGILLLIVLGGFYVVSPLFLMSLTKKDFF